MAKITYEDKVALDPQPSIANVNKCTADDLNEIKNSVNALYDGIEESYTLTNTPAHSGGTNTQYIYKIGKLVVINCNLWCNNLTQNSWTEIGTLPADIIPTGNINGMATIVSGANGNYLGLGLIDISDGKLRIKPNIAISNSLSGIRINVTYGL